MKLVKRRVLAFSLLAILAACTKPPELVGSQNTLRLVEAEPNAVTRKVFITTTREASEVVEVFYSGERAPDLGLASVVVSIPPNHVAGEIERPKKLPPDPETEFAVIEPTVYRSENSFISSINKELAKLKPEDREILFFVHGYNNTTSDSILRMAQFIEDTNFSGVPVLFSWASAAKTTHYVYDLNSALAARPLFLKAGKILRQTNATGFDLFAHSMGGFLTVESIVQASLAGKYNNTGRLDNVMLASPDIDLDVFKSQLAELPEKDRNFVIFASEDDKALSFSSWISGGVSRVGESDAQELEALGVTVIDLSKIDDSASGSHSKFAGSPAVVQLIGKSLKNNNYNSKPNQAKLVEILDGVPIVSAVVE